MKNKTVFKVIAMALLAGIFSLGASAAEARAGQVQPSAKAQIVGGEVVRPANSKRIKKSNHVAPAKARARKSARRGTHRISRKRMK